MTGLIDRIGGPTVPVADKQAQALLRDLVALDEGDTPALHRAIRENGPAANLLAGVATGSPYLWTLCRADLCGLDRILASDPDQSLDAATSRAREACEKASDQADIMRALRRLKQEAALIIALADLGGVWPLAKVTLSLSTIADFAISVALRWLLAQAAASGHIALKDSACPETSCGLIVVAMGKHGAHELNYSSDVDLIVLYDPERATLREGAEPSAFFVRLTKGLVRLLSERTSDGYAFRIDLRLRPDPGATAIAISLPAAFDYYESVGQNWERAAFIKARACAGDLEAGQDFLKAVAPFIWRKHLDYAAIADIHAMKRQINAHRGHEAIAVLGHNIKLGWGGIREIEFFVQTQQLIAGGRNPRLRSSNTLIALKELAEAGWIQNESRDELSEAYRFLRCVEHRLQMVADEQTHSLPNDEKTLTRFSRFAGVKSSKAFSIALVKRLETVQRHYNRLFESAPELSIKVGSLVFTGKSDDPETIETLAKLGFSSPSAAAEMIRGWHFGRYASMRSARAREDLTELTPVLLSAMSREGRPDASLLAFDRMLGRMPSGFQLFSILRNNTKLLDILARILGVAPRLADMLALHPHAFDGLLEPSDQKSPLRSDVLQRLKATFTLSSSYEEALDHARILVRERMFATGAKVLSGDLPIAQAGLSFSAIAEASVQALLELVDGHLACAHGRPRGTQVAVLAMGKLGGHEMTAASDLDLVVLYNHDPDALETPGPRSISPAAWFGRLTQRLIAALSAPTAQGILFPVDMRLRPSGQKGPVAVHFEAFRSYHFADAWTWEHMALTRARVIAGGPEFGDQVTNLIRSILLLKRDEEKVRRDVVEMRRLLMREKPAESLWDLKSASGGLIDIEFIVQFLQLAHARRHSGVLATNTKVGLERLHQAHFLSNAQYQILQDAWRFYSNIAQLSRLCLDMGANPGTGSNAFQAMLTHLMGEPDFKTLQTKLTENYVAVHDMFLQLTKRTHQEHNSTHKA